MPVVMSELRTVFPVYNLMLILLFVSSSLPQVPWEKLLEVPRLRLEGNAGVSSRWCETLSSREPNNGYSLGTRGPGSLGRRGNSDGEIGG